MLSNMQTQSCKITAKDAEKAIGQAVVRDGPRLMTKSGQGDSVKFLEYFYKNYAN